MTTTTLRTRLGINTEEREMQRMEAEADRAQTIREETAKAEFKAAVETAQPRRTVMTELRARMDEHNMRGVWLPNVKITRAKPSSTNPGALYITAAQGGDYLGKITADGQLRTVVALPEIIRNEMRAFATRGTAYLAEVGIETGQCCYCGRELSDPDSVKLGYGPVCAKTYSLPHPNRHGF